MRYVDLDAPSQRLRPQKPPKKWLKPALIVAFVTVLVYAGYSLFWPTAATLADIFKAPAAVLSFIRPPEDSLKSTNGRTNILLLGTDYRKDMPGENLTDTMMVASINLKSPKKDVVMISVPRDLWVKLPSWKLPDGKGNFYSQGAKINSANTYGDLYSYPDGKGLGAARTVMGEVLGLEIHYVVRVNFYGFQQMVDAVGGVSVNVQKTFTDCEYPVLGRENSYPLSSRYKCITFTKGFQYMDGQKALEFVRSRHGNNGEGDDIARARRQQLIILAVRDKALTLSTLTDPLKLAGLIKSLGDNLATLDVDFSQIGQFYKIAQGVDVGGAEQIVLSANPRDEAGLLVIPPQSSFGGASVFIPRAGVWDYTEIHEFVTNKLADAAARSATSSAQLTGR